MDARQRSWPRIWLMTDERMGERLWDAVARLPSGGGIVLRHYSLAPRQREELALRLAPLVKDRRLTLAIGHDDKLAERVGASLVHNPAGGTGELPFSRSVHNRAEAQAAKAASAALVFVSPVHPTRSHPEREPLGAAAAADLARITGTPAIALGGMDGDKFALFERGSFYGWAGIDAWLKT